MVNLGHNQNFVWWAILRAQFIVRGGVRWCIGLENSIPILQEPWPLNGGHIDGNILGAHYVCNFSINCIIDTLCKSWNLEPRFGSESFPCRHSLCYFEYSFTSTCPG